MYSVCVRDSGLLGLLDRRACLQPTQAVKLDRVLVSLDGSAPSHWEKVSFGSSSKLWPFCRCKMQTDFWDAFAIWRLHCYGQLSKHFSIGVPKHRHWTKPFSDLLYNQLCNSMNCKGDNQQTASSSRGILLWCRMNWLYSELPFLSFLTAEEIDALRLLALSQVPQWC